jgi:NADH-quinone oxidoreductase subunit F
MVAPNKPPEYRLILKHADDADYTSDLACYQRHGGYETLRRAMEQTPEEIRKEVLDSGVKGRGGAGFPAGMKWKFLDYKSGKPIYLVCNADESEPGTFKDRQIMYKDPHQLLEGMMITAYAIGAKQAFIYIRGEYVNGAKILQTAIDEAKAAGLAGEDILGKGYSCDIVICRGAGAYICGEETGLIESLEGKRGYPRIKPPYFPAALGLYMCPTIVNNVETLCHVKHVIELGAAAYQKIGVPGDPGTHILGVSGNVRNPGYWEFEAGKITYGQLLYDIAGGPKDGRKFKAIIPGGMSMKILKVGETFRGKDPVTGEAQVWNVEDIPVDAGSLMACGTALGTGGVIAIDDSVDMLEVLANINAFYAHESCGQCTPCREGSLWLNKITKRLTSLNGDNGGREADIDQVLTIANQVAGRTICAHGEALAWPVQSAQPKFKEEYLASLRSRQQGKRPVGGYALI